MRNKRAALEMGITTIVVVILAMTLLGLGLGFIRNMFSDIGSVSKEVNDQTKQKILDDLITSDKKVSFPSTDIKLDKGDDQIMTVGIRNKPDTPLCYKIIFEGVEDNEGNPFDTDEWFKYTPGPDDDCEAVEPADSIVKNIQLKVPRSATAGTYLLQFQVVDDDAPAGENAYERKDLFITVRG